MDQLSLVQGSPQWHAHRRNHWNASDAPAMMGCSPYESRTQLLHRLATGIEPEIDAATQRRFNDGHRFEALARPLAEAIIGEDLFPVVGTEGRYSASFDGLTMDEATAFEHKTLGESLRYTPWDEGNGDHLPAMYRVQMEHQLIVSGAQRVLFMATRWEGNECVERQHCWYVSDPALRAQIIAGWQQFEADLLAYQAPEAAAPAPVGHAPETLPALRIEINGAVSASNLGDFKAIALKAIRSVNRELTTDQHFADAEESVKWCAEVESKIKGAKEHALSQTATIDELFKALDDISAEARTVRLSLEKLVKERKESIRGEIVATGIEAFRTHIASLNARIGKPYMPQTPPAFGEAIKGKRTVASLRSAVDAELARAKIAANEIADRLQINLRAILDAGAPGLFADEAILAHKEPEFVTLTIAQRLADEKRRQDEAAERAQAEAAQRAAQAAAATPIPAPVAAPAPAPDKVFSITRPAADDGKRMKLGDINARLAPIALTADGLAGLGFKHIAVDKAAKLYRESDFPLICNALVAHVNAARDTAPLAA